MQIAALSLLLKNTPSWRSGPDKVSLILIGSCRNKDDYQRVEALKKQTIDLKLEVFSDCFFPLKTEKNTFSIKVSTFI